MLFISGGVPHKTNNISFQKSVSVVASGTSDNFDIFFSRCLQ
jgi:uncharacterized RmlC-like cupin family protein